MHHALDGMIIILNIKTFELGGHCKCVNTLTSHASCRNFILKVDLKQDPFCRLKIFVCTTLLQLTSSNVATKFLRNA
jgi:hypothetical protein